MNWLGDQQTLISIAIGIAIGTLTRLSLLRTDYRQYPTYPHGRIIHLSLGVIAAGLGAVAVPAFLDKDFTAITFLSLAAQQFREVRNMERETLAKLDEMELVPRGASYIEGIAMVFEGRNYLVIFSSLATTCVSILLTWYWGIAFGIAAIVIGLMLRSGKTLKDIATIETADVIQDGPNLYVGDIYIMNVGLRASQQIISEQAIGLIAVPKNKNARAILSNLGQRQALLHDLSTIMGVCRDSGEPSLLPLSKLDISDGRLGIFLIPQEKDVRKAQKVTLDVPLLESAMKMPTDIKV